jgi:hypothetical protein
MTTPSSQPGRKRLAKRLTLQLERAVVKAMEIQIGEPVDQLMADRIATQVQASFKAILPDFKVKVVGKPSRDDSH